MKKVSLMIAVFFVFSAVGQNPKKHYKSANKLYESQLLDEALNELNQAINIDGNYGDAYLLRGKVFEAKKDWSSAVTDYEKAVKLEENSPSVLFLAGQANYMVKDYADAAKYLNEAALLNDKNFQVLYLKSATHIKLAEFHDAIVAIDKAIKIDENHKCLYIKGVANDSIKNYTEAIMYYNKAIAKKESYKKAYFALSIAYLNNKETDKALNTANSAVSKFSTEQRAYEVRSEIYHSKGDLANAINDLSKLETMVDDNKEVLCKRGKYFFEFGQYLNAKSDFAQLLSKSDTNYEAAYWKARSNEELMENEEATSDYNTFLSLLAKNNIESQFSEDAKKRIFELNREENAPVLVIDTPMVIDNSYLAIVNNADRITITGKVKDASKITSFTINDINIELNDSVFEYNMAVGDASIVSIKAIDIYKNEMLKDFTLKNVETNLPVVFITTPYAGDNGEVYLDSDDQNLFLEGRIEDESTIADIYINDIRASFNDTEVNPIFTATIDIFNKDKFTVRAVDIFNNETITTFTLNREGAQIAEGNPMGKTWVVFIENSNYETFASLEGPTKDVSTMKSALSNYEIHNFIHKKDMSKKDMERFFSIELRDQVKKNNVNSLLVWYAGHGKFINETGYWIPTDATRDDEFTYFNINSLKAGMQSYSNYITHTLVITDACESGPSFYQAMRADTDEKSCDDVSATKFKSSQVFSSAGYELASDNSQFTKTFAKSLQFNENACMPIESIVVKVTQAVADQATQKPQFGKIAGFEDENGTFFFIRK